MCNYRGEVMMWNCKQGCALQEASDSIAQRNGRWCSRIVQLQQGAFAYALVSSHTNMLCTQQLDGLVSNLVTELHCMTMASPHCYASDVTKAVIGKRELSTS
jgi:hypothetical protein